MNNAHILYKHNCRRFEFRHKDSLAFHLKLVHLLLARANCCKCQHSLNTESHGGDSPGECRVTENVLKKRRCFHCLRTKPAEDRHCTSYGCACCRACLCKIQCFVDLHNHLLYDSIVSLYQNSVEITLSGHTCNFTTGKDYAIAVLYCKISSKF